MIARSVHMMKFHMEAARMVSRQKGSQHEIRKEQIDVNIIRYVVIDFLI